MMDSCSKDNLEDPMASEPRVNAPYGLEGLKVKI